MGIFPNEKNYSQPLLYDEWLWKLVFAADFIMFLNEFNLKLQGKTLLTCKPSIVVVILTTNVWIISHVKLPYTLLWCQKWKQVRSPSLHGDTVAMVFCIPVGIGRTLQYFKIHLPVPLWSLHRTVNWKWFKGKCKCLLRDKYAQLKSCLRNDNYLFGST